MPSQVVENPTYFQSSLGGGNTYYLAGTRRDRTWVNTLPSWSAYSRSHPWDKPYNTYYDVRWDIKHSSYAVQTSDYLGNPPYTIMRDWGYVGTTSAAARDNWASGGVGLVKASLTSVDRLSNEALIRNLNRAADVRVNLAVAIGESRKTSAMILDTAKRLAFAMNAARRGNFGVVAAALDVRTGKHRNFLAYKMGWLPLLQDVRGAAEMFAQQHFPRPPTFRIVTRATSEVGYSKVESNQYGWQGNGKAAIVRSGFASREVEHDIWYEYQSRSWATAQQLGLTNPASLFWELMPASFLIDYLIGVGSWLQAVTSLQGLTIKRSGRAVLDVTEYTRTIAEPTHTSWPYRHNGFSTKDQCAVREYTRAPFVVNTGALYPPVDRDPFKWGRLLNLLALVRQRVPPTWSTMEH